MSFTEVDKLINNIQTEHKFNYLCSSQYPYMEIPEIKQYRIKYDIVTSKSLANQENVNYNENINYNEIQNKFSKIKKSLENLNYIECPVCMNYCNDYVKPKCNHKICVKCFMENNKTQYGNKCCLCRRQYI
jgi:Zn-dependent metalloprotease